MVTQKHFNNENGKKAITVGERITYISCTIVDAEKEKQESVHQEFELRKKKGFQKDGGI